MDDQSAKIKALFISPESEKTFGVSELLIGMGYDVFCRDNRHQGLTLLQAIKADLLVMNYDLGGGDPVELCAALRRDPAFEGLKVVIVGDDDRGCSKTIACLNAGADDFIAPPFPDGLFEARVGRLTRKNANADSSLSVTIEANELPGILSFLEAEFKTGRLEVRHAGTTAMIYLFEGRLVNGEAPGCEGLDAVVEALCFPNAHVTFHEEDVDEDKRAFSMETTGTIMNCVFKVDEFHEAKKLLPRDDAQFGPGKDLSEDAENRQRRIHRAALEGMPISQILADLGIGERHATMTLKRLIEDQHLEVLPGPFSHYSQRTRDYLAPRSTKNLQRRLLDVRNDIDAIEMPVSTSPGPLGFSDVDWLSPVPKIMLLGHNADHVRQLVHSLELLHVAVNNVRPMTRKVPANARVTRLRLGDQGELDILVMPPRLGPVIHHWSDVAEDAFAVAFICSSQDDAALKHLTKNIRTLRKKFTGVYYFVVPQVPDQDGNPTFTISCRGCGFTLSADVRYTGTEGECPICSASFAFPDCLDHLAERLFLPSDVPVIQLVPDAPDQAADLLRMIFDSFVSLCGPPPDELDAENRQAPIENTEVRERTVVQFVEEDAAAVPDQPTELAQVDPENYYAELATQTEVAPETPEPQQQAQPDALDELLDGGIFGDDDSGGDDFDVDEFLRATGQG